MDKDIMSGISDIKKLESLSNTFWNRRAVRRAKKRLMKTIKKAARQYAELAYKQAYDLYSSIIDSNLN